MEKVILFGCHNLNSQDLKIREIGLKGEDLYGTTLS
jgi:hypothetical protein